MNKDIIAIRNDIIKKFDKKRHDCSARTTMLHGHLFSPGAVMYLLSIESVFESDDASVMASEIFKGKFLF